MPIKAKRKRIERMIKRSIKRKRIERTIKRKRIELKEQESDLEDEELKRQEAIFNKPIDDSDDEVSDSPANWIDREIYGPTITSSDMRRLQTKSVEDTIAMYTHLEKEGKMPKDMRWNTPAEMIDSFRLAQSEFDEDPDGFLDLDARSMEYYFTGRATKSPFVGLRLNRYAKDGELVCHLRPSEWEDMFAYELHVERAHRYTLLLERIRSCFERPWWKEDFRSSFEFFRAKANDMGLDRMSDLDIEICMTEAWDKRYNNVHQRELDFYRYLSELKSVDDREKVWEDVQIRFPLIDEKTFKKAVDRLYPSGEKCSSEELAKRMMRVEKEYKDSSEWLREGNVGNILSPSKYYKLKLARAAELGIIKKTKEGIYREVSPFLWKF